MKKLRYVLVSFLLLLILIFLIYNYYIHVVEIEKNKTSKETKAIERQLYLNILNEPMNYAKKIEKYMPLIIDEEINTTMYNRYIELDDKQLIDIIGNLTNTINHLVESLIGSCNNTLWEDYVKLVIFYELSVFDLLEKAKTYIVGENVTIIRGGRVITLHSKYRETGIQYIVLASSLIEKARTSLNNSDLRSYLCRYKREAVEGKIIKLYNITKRYLLEKSVETLNRILHSNYTNINNRLMRSFIMKLQLRLNNSQAFFSNETIFYDTLRENELNALRAILKGFIELYGDLLALNNETLLMSVNKLMLRSDFIRQKISETIYLLDKLHNRTRNDPLRLLIYYMVVIEYYKTIYNYYIVINNTEYEYLNRSVIEEILANIPGVDETFIYIILYPDIIKGIMSVILNNLE